MSPGDGRGGEERALAAARRLTGQSRSRAAAFGPHARLFRDPAWDMLLAAFALGSSTGLPIKSLSVSSGVPMTTALRYIGLLTRAGLIERMHNARDRRSTLVRLTDEGRRRMTDFLGRQD